MLFLHKNLFISAVVRLSQLLKRTVFLWKYYVIFWINSGHSFRTVE